VKLPRDIDPQRFIRALAVLGYKQTRQVGSHIRVTTNSNGEHHEVIPNHKPIKVGALQSILASIARHHEMSVEDILRILNL
jgi:predicted RNA binding protein YcfA (HicA-like mRNA interferase family)